MRHKSSVPKYDKMCSRISFGRSFSDVGSMVITGASEKTSFLLLHVDAVCSWSYTGSKILKHK